MTKPSPVSMRLAEIAIIALEQCGYSPVGSAYDKHFDATARALDEAGVAEAVLQLEGGMKAATDKWPMDACKQALAALKGEKP